MPVEGIFWKCFVETSAKRTRTKSMPRGYRSVLIQGRFNTEIRILSLCDQSVKDQPDLIKKIIISQIKRQISDVRELRVDHRYSHTEAWAIVNEVRTLPYNRLSLVRFFRWRENFSGYRSLTTQNNKFHTMVQFSSALAVYGTGQAIPIQNSRSVPICWIRVALDIDVYRR